MADPEPSVIAAAVATREESLRRWGLVNAPNKRLRRAVLWAEGPSEILGAIARILTTREIKDGS